MPELPDILAYTKALSPRVVGRRLERIRLASPFLLRTAEPPIAEARGRRVEAIRRIGKRIVLGLDDDLFLVFHLMISGRFQWKPQGAPKLGGKVNLAAFDFEGGASLLMTEASTKKRASLHLVRGEAALRQFDRGGLEVLDATTEAFDAALRSENHTLKRALTDPRLFSGIGNAFSDEILHRAQLSPGKLTQKLPTDEAARLFDATRAVLTEWIDRLDPGADGPFPEKVTAFRPEMAVHGKYNQPCPVCGSPVQRIVYADNESNYCATCQTGGRLLADRSMSRLLKSDWPRTLEELEESRASRMRGDVPA
ncbi:MAG TPA: DNA-formamidopyrimidine glycosylase family protein [Chthonomonadaceae bacterium]|nr:DNA-formamidopyrimidine glycosylase family protein [Chthonomonadaceae bacterium]